MVIKLLRPIEAKGSLETVKRLSQRLNEIMTYGVNSGLIFATPPSVALGGAQKKPRKENMAALRPDELPELMMEIANASIKRVTRCLIEWQLHTMTRPVEAATTRWADIDFDKRIWTIPPERMKKRRPHTIPLTEQALALLETLKTHSGHREYVFPADRNPRTVGSLHIGCQKTQPLLQGPFKITEIICVVEGSAAQEIIGSKRYGGVEGTAQRGI